MLMVHWHLSLRCPSRVYLLLLLLIILILRR